MLGNNTPMEIIATINTTKADKEFICNVVEHGATILRINGAHVLPENIVSAVDKLREYTQGLKVKIMVDLPGNKIRTKNIYEEIRLQINENFELSKSNFNFEGFIDYLNVGNLVFSSDAQLKMETVKVSQNSVTFKALTNGVLLNNKGMHVQDKDLSNLPFVTERDELLLSACIKSSVDFVGLSFVRSAENIQQVRKLLAGIDIKLIVKLETKEGTSKKVLEEILNNADIFSIDRGDLFSEVGFEKFPETFISVMDATLKNKKKLFIATQLFASMYNHNVPFLSEVMEFYRLAKSGIYGIQLSEEIAVGLHPIEVLDTISLIAKQARK